MFILYKLELPNNPKDPIRFIPVLTDICCAVLRREMNRRNSKGERYSTRDNRVLKVTSSQDDGWPTFITYALQHQDNPHLPRIDNWKARCDPNGRWRLSVVMEKLNPLNDIGEDFRLYCSIRYTFAELSTKQNLDELIKLDVPDTLKMVMIDLAVLCKSNNLAPDLHGENIMRRADGTLVIIDPFAAGRPTEQNPWMPCCDARDHNNNLHHNFDNPYYEPYSWGRKTTFPRKKEISRLLIN